MGGERRRHPRIRLEGSVVGRATVIADFRVSSFSPTGAILEMAVPIAEGSACDLSFAFDDSPLNLKGRVVRIDPPRDAGGAYLVVVDYEGMDAEDRAFLRTFLAGEGRTSS